MPTKISCGVSLYTLSLSLEVDPPDVSDLSIFFPCEAGVKKNVEKNALAHCSFPLLHSSSHPFHKERKIKEGGGWIADAYLLLPI